MDKTKFEKYVRRALNNIFDAFVFCGAVIFVFIVASEFSSTEKDNKKISGHSITVTSKGHEYIIFETDRGNTCCTHSASCQCYKNK